MNIPKVLQLRTEQILPTWVNSAISHRVAMSYANRQNVDGRTAAIPCSHDDGHERKDN